MKARIQILTTRCALLALVSSFILQPSALVSAVPLGTAFTYQGQLTDGGAPANGTYDLKFTLYDAVTSGGQVGSPLTTNAVAVSNGSFAVALDFGAGIFTGEARWLDIAVKTNGAGAYTPLTPRQALTPAPYAITAGNLSGALPAAQLSGTIRSANVGGTYANAVTFNNAANSFTGNGSGLTSLNASQLATGMVPDARLASERGADQSGVAARGQRGHHARHAVRGYGG
jgi:hypothetical protein